METIIGEFEFKSRTFPKTVHHKDVFPNNSLSLVFMDRLYDAERYNPVCFGIGMIINQTIICAVDDPVAELRLIIL